MSLERHEGYSPEDEVAGELTEFMESFPEADKELMGKAMAKIKGMGDPEAAKTALRRLSNDMADTTGEEDELNRVLGNFLKGNSSEHAGESKENEAEDEDDLEDDDEEDDDDEGWGSDEEM